MSIVYQPSGKPKRNVEFHPNCFSNEPRPSTLPLYGSTFGSVHEVPAAQYAVVKMIKLGDTTIPNEAIQSIADFEREVAIAEQVGLLGIGPGVEGFHVCEGEFEDNEERFKFGFLYLTKIAVIQVSKYVTELNTIPKDCSTQPRRIELAESLIAALENLKSLCFSHGVYNPNLHQDNIMVDLNLNKTVKKAYMIDCMACTIDPRDQRMTQEKILVSWNSIIGSVNLSLQHITRCGPPSLMIPLPSSQHVAGRWDRPKAGMLIGPREAPHRYTLVERIGEGASASIWHATHSQTGAPVAIKIAFAGSRDTPIGDEVAALQEIPIHPHVLSILDSFGGASGDDAGPQCIVTQLADQGDFFSYLQKKGTLSEDEARSVFIALLSAIEATHAAGYCHRDIKLENILFLRLADRLQSTPELQALLANQEFMQILTALKQRPDMLQQIFADVQRSNPGLMQTIQDNQEAFMALLGPAPILLGDYGGALPCGPDRPLYERGGTTPFYAAPEVQDLFGGGYDGTKADIWSAGIILYAMVVGGFPFDSASPWDRGYTDFRAGVHTWPQEISAELKDLIQRILTHEAEDRLTLREIADHPWIKRE